MNVATSYNTDSKKVRMLCLRTVKTMTANANECILVFICILHSVPPVAGIEIVFKGIVQYFGKYAYRYFTFLSRLRGHD